MPDSTTPSTPTPYNLRWVPEPRSAWRLLYDHPEYGEESAGGIHPFGTRDGRPCWLGMADLIGISKTAYFVTEETAEEARRKVENYAVGLLASGVEGERGEV